MKHNLIAYFKAFYQMGLQHSFDTETQCLFWALLFKFNSLNYKENIRISNKELTNISGIPLRSFHRHREQLIKYLHDENDPDSWISHYTEGTTREYGTYNMNFPYIWSFAPAKQENELVPNMQQNGIIDNVANELVPNMQQKCQLDQLASSLKGTSLQNDDQNGTLSYTILDKDKTKQNLSLSSTSIISSTNQNGLVVDDEQKKEDIDFDETKRLITEACQSFKIVNIKQGNTIREISKYPLDKRKTVCERAGLSGITAGFILSYIKDGLLNYEQKYGNNSKKSYSNEATPYKNNEKQLAEDKAIHEKKMKGEYYE